MEKEGGTSFSFPCQHRTTWGGSSSATKREKPKYCMGVAAVRRYAKCTGAACPRNGFVGRRMVQSVSSVLHCVRASMGSHILTADTYD